MAACFVVSLEDVLQMTAFLQYGGHNEEEKSYEATDKKQKGQDNGNDAEADAALMLQKIHHRVEQIGQ